MSEDDGHESGCDTVEGSPTSDTSTSPRDNSSYHYLDNSNHNNRPPLAAIVAPLPSPTLQGRSPRGIRTMVVPPMRVQNNNTRGTEERVQRTGQCLFFQGKFCLTLWHAWTYLSFSFKHKCVSSLTPVTCALVVSALQVIWNQWGLTAP